MGVRILSMLRNISPLLTHKQLLYILASLSQLLIWDHWGVQRGGFGGGITPDLTAPCVTPDLTAPPKILTAPPYHPMYVIPYQSFFLTARVNSFPPQAKCENRWGGKEFTWGGKKVFVQFAISEIFLSN